MAFVTSLLWQWSDGQTQAAPAATTPDVGHAGRPRRRKEYVVIDDVVFEVANDREAVELIRRAHELAREAAAAKAQAALEAQQAKEARRPRKRAKPAPLPSVELPKIDVSAGLAEQLQAQLADTRDAIADIYRQALIRAVEARAQEERDVIAVLEAVDKAESELLALYLKELD